MSDTEKMLNLLDDELFQEMIIDKFIKGGLIDTALYNSLNADATIDELKARQLLHKYIFGIINSVTTPNLKKG